MLVEEILKIQCWSPLKLIKFKLVKIGEDTFKVTDNFYLMAQEYNENFVTGLSDAPFVTQAYWASNETAFRKIVMRQGNNALIFSQKDNIPSVLLINSNGTYGDLLNNNESASSEYATYNSEGEFICKNVTIGRFTYHFSSLKIEMNQTPIVITIGL